MSPVSLSTTKTSSTRYGFGGDVSEPSSFSLFYFTIKTSRAKWRLGRTEFMNMDSISRNLY